MFVPTAHGQVTLLQLVHVPLSPPGSLLPCFGYSLQLSDAKQIPNDLLCGVCFLIMSGFLELMGRVESVESKSPGLRISWE